MLGGNVVQKAALLRASDDPPPTVPLEARVVTHTCQLCPRSSLWHWEGSERLIRVSTFPLALPCYYPLFNRGSYLDCVASRSGNVDLSLIFCADANYIFTLCLKQKKKKKNTITTQKPHTHKHTHTRPQFSECDYYCYFLFLLFYKGFGYRQIMLLISIAWDSEGAH